MRQSLRNFFMGSAGFLRDKLPFLPVMGKLGLFNSARTTRRYLSGLSAAPAAAPVAEPVRTPRVRDKVNVWFIADVYWERKELIPELQKIGDLTVTDLCAARTMPVARELTLDIVKKAVDDVHPDVIVLYAREGLLSEELFQVLRTRQVPIWGMNCDDKIDFFPNETAPYQARDGYGRWARFFDLNLVSSRALVPHYAAASAGRALFFPEGFHLRPEFLQPRPSIVDTISFVGSWRETRAQLIDQVQAYGLKVQVYGGGWPESKMIEEPWRVYRASQITLGDGMSPGSYTTNLKPRDFETPGSNACCLTTYNWELADQFEIGREILCYRDANELVELLAYYQSRPDDCRQIAEAGFARACAEHTWEKRFRKLFAARL